MLNSHELRLLALQSKRREMERIPVEEEQEALARTQKRLEVERAEFRFLLRASLNEGVPVGQIREAVGAKNWKTWARMKRDYNLGGAN
jgi:hypothetical protein